FISLICDTLKQVYCIVSFFLHSLNTEYSTITLLKFRSSNWLLEFYSQLFDICKNIPSYPYVNFAVLINKERDDQYRK
ncbi:MAG: hypothetical protein ACK5M3_08250, partial [Dysgonomonas sp.]